MATRTSDMHAGDEKFAAADLSVLVASDLACAGSTSTITHVINFDLPEDPGFRSTASARTARGRDAKASLWRSCPPDRGELLTNTRLPHLASRSRG